MNKLMALLAFAVFVGFVGILIIYVPSPDLIAVVALSVALVGYDFFTSALKKTDENG